VRVHEKECVLDVCLRVSLSVGLDLSEGTLQKKSTHMYVYSFVCVLADCSCLNMLQVQSNGGKEKKKKLYSCKMLEGVDAANDIFHIDAAKLTCRCFSSRACR
jgi:hypothetical protein